MAADLISKIYDVISMGSHMEDWNILCLVHKHREDWNILCLVHKHMEDWNILCLKYKHIEDWNILCLVYKHNYGRLKYFIFLCINMEDGNILCLVHKHMEDWNSLCLVHKHMEDWNILFGLVMVQLLWNLNLKALDLFYQVRLKITILQCNRLTIKYSTMRRMWI